MMVGGKTAGGGDGGKMAGGDDGGKTRWRAARKRTQESIYFRTEDGRMGTDKDTHRHGTARIARTRGSVHTGA